MSNQTLKEKLEIIMNLAHECLGELGETDIAPTVKNVTKNNKEVDVGITLKIVNKIGDCEEADEIQKNILDKHSAEGKVLLCFYISHKYFKNEWLGAGDIEKITAELGIKIDVRNASNYLKTYRSYLESGSTRKKGQPTPYRINRKGIKRFEEIIHAKKD